MGTVQTYKILSEYETKMLGIFPSYTKQIKTVIADLYIIEKDLVTDYIVGKNLINYNTKTVNKDQLRLDLATYLESKRIKNKFTYDEKVSQLKVVGTTGIETPGVIVSFSRKEARDLGKLKDSLKIQERNARIAANYLLLSVAEFDDISGKIAPEVEKKTKTKKTK